MPNRAGSPWALATAIGLGLTVVLLAGPAFAVAAQFDIGAHAVWIVAARLVLRQPVQWLGIVWVFGIIVWGAVVLSPAVLFGLGPFAVLCAAIARGGFARVIAQDGDRGVRSVMR